MTDTLTCVAPDCKRSFDWMPNKRYCSRACADRTNDRLAKIPWRLCPAINCGNTFMPKNGNHRFCSKACQERVLAMRRRKHFEKKPCDQCGEVYKPRQNGQRFCSNRCRELTSNGRRRNPQLPDRPCRNCAGMFTPRNRLNLFCSRRCHNRWHHEARIVRVDYEHRDCERCGTTFKPKQWHQRYCCRKCNHDAAKQRWLAKPENVETQKQARARWRAANPEYERRAGQLRRRRKKIEQDAAQRAS